MCCRLYNDTVPSAPRRLRLSLVEEDPPVVYLSWQAPVLVHGSLAGYQLVYHIEDAEVDDEDAVDRRSFDADKQHFTTTFLGLYPGQLGK